MKKRYFLNKYFLKMEKLDVATKPNPNRSKACTIAKIIQNYSDFVF